MQPDLHTGVRALYPHKAHVAVAIVLVDVPDDGGDISPRRHRPNDVGIVICLERHLRAPARLIAHQLNVPPVSAAGEEGRELMIL